LESRDTDKEVLAYRPDTIVRNKAKTCLLIDVAIPSHTNTIQKEAEEKLIASVLPVLPPWKQTKFHTHKQEILERPNSHNCLTLYNIKYISCTSMG
jgi:hypothetical protein